MHKIDTAPPLWAHKMEERHLAARLEVERSLRTTRFQSALRAWRSDGNPVSAFEALAHWDRTEPLPDDLAAFLVTSSSAFIEEIKKYTTFSERSWTVSAGVTALANAFGFASAGKKGGNAFAQFRDATLSRNAAEAYLESCISNPNMKSEAIVAALVSQTRGPKRAAISKAQMYRYIQAGMKALGVTFQKRGLPPR